MRKRERAIELRLEGATYSEIQTEVNVARSTLSLWLRSVQLSNKQEQRILQKKLASARRGGYKRRTERLTLSENIKSLARSEIRSISERELWLMGVMLYWAEGAKDRFDRISQGIVFSNSDPNMIRLFLSWLVKILKLTDDRFVFEIYIHDMYKDNIEMFREFWSTSTGYSIDKFDRIYFKRNKIGTKRQNSNERYRGLLRVKVTKSTNLNRKISGWIESISNHCGMV